MAVTVNATATAVVNQASGTATISNTNLTVASGATALLVWLEFTGGLPTGITVNWDNTGTPQALTLLVSQANAASTGACTLWGLVHPTIGNKTLTASWSGTSYSAALDAIAFSGTASDTVAHAFQHATSTNGTGSSASLTATSATGNINCCGIAAASHNISSLSATGSTSVWVDNTHVDSGGARATGAATVAWSGAISASSSYAIAAVDVSIGDSVFVQSTLTQLSPVVQAGQSNIAFTPLSSWSGDFFSGDFGAGYPVISVSANVQAAQTSSVSAILLTHLSAVGQAGQSDRVTAIPSSLAISTVAAVQNPVPVSAIDLVTHLSAAGQAGQSDLVTAVPVALSVSAVAAVQNPVPIAAKDTITVLTAVGQAGQSDVLSGVPVPLLISVIASVQNPLPVSAKDSITTLTAVVQAGQSDRVTAVPSSLVISTVAAVQNPVPVSAQDTLTALHAVGQAGQSNIAFVPPNPWTSDFSSDFGAGYLVITVSANVQAGQNDLVAVQDTIMVLHAVATGQIPFAASATDTLAVVSAVVGAGQSDGAHGTVQLATMSAVGTGQNPVPASAADTLTTLAAVAQAGQSDLVTAVPTALMLHAAGAGQNPFGASATINFATMSVVAAGYQGSGFNASAQITLDVLRVVGAVINPWPVSVVASVGSTTAAVQVGQSDVAFTPLNPWSGDFSGAFGAGYSVITVSAVGSFGQADPVVVQDIITVLSSVGSAGQLAPLSAIVQLPSVRATGFVGNPWPATAKITIATVTAAGIAQQGGSVAALVQVPTVTPAITVQNPLPVSAKFTLATISAAGIGFLADLVSAGPMVPTLRATATVANPVPISAQISLGTISVQAQCGQLAPISATAMLAVVCTGVFLQTQFASCIATILPPSANVRAVNASNAIDATGSMYFSALARAYLIPAHVVTTNRVVAFDHDDRLIDA